MEGQEEGQQHCAKPLRESFKSYYPTCIRVIQVDFGAIISMRPIGRQMSSMHSDSKTLV